MRRIPPIALFALLALAAATSAAQAPATADAPAPAAAAAKPTTEPGTRFAAADKNGDGKLDQAEATALHARLGEHFGRVDRNDDQAIDQDELRAAHRHARHRAQHARSQRHVRMAYMRGLLTGMDDDKDQALTRAEIGDKAPRLSERFDQIDGNRDGKLTREELRAARPAGPGRGHEHGRGKAGPEGPGAQAAPAKP